MSDVNPNRPILTQPVLSLTQYGGLPNGNELDPMLNEDGKFDLNKIQHMLHETITDFSYIPKLIADCSRELVLGIQSSVSGGDICMSVYRKYPNHMCRVKATIDTATCITYMTACAKFYSRSSNTPTAVVMQRCIVAIAAFCHVEDPELVVAAEVEVQEYVALKSQRLALSRSLSTAYATGAPLQDTSIAPSLPSRLTLPEVSPTQCSVPDPSPHSSAGHQYMGQNVPEFSPPVPYYPQYYCAKLLNGPNRPKTLTDFYFSSMAQPMVPANIKYDTYRYKKDDSDTNTVKTDLNKVTQKLANAIRLDVTDKATIVPWLKSIIFDYQGETLSARCQLRYIHMTSQPDKSTASTKRAIENFLMYPGVAEEADPHIVLTWLIRHLIDRLDQHVGLATAYESFKQLKRPPGLSAILWIDSLEESYRNSQLGTAEDDRSFGKIICDRYFDSISKDYCKDEFLKMTHDYDRAQRTNLKFLKEYLRPKTFELNSPRHEFHAMGKHALENPEDIEAKREKLARIEKEVTRLNLSTEEVRKLCEQIKSCYHDVKCQRCLTRHPDSFTKIKASATLCRGQIRFLDMRCSKCGSFKHMLESCEKTPTLPCKRCAQVGHYTAVCPAQAPATLTAEQRADIRRQYEAAQQRRQ